MSNSNQSEKSTPILPLGGDRGGLIKFIIQLIIAILTAVLTSLGVTSCMH